jgi:hypothetical protein
MFWKNVIEYDSCGLEEVKLREQDYVAPRNREMCDSWKFCPQRLRSCSAKLQMKTLHVELEEVKLYLQHLYAVSPKKLDVCL